MIKIVCANQKGGVGKTALVVNMAFFFALKKNYRVLVLDLDTQADTSYTLADYSIPGFGADCIFSDRSLPAGLSVKNGDIVLLESSRILSDVELTGTADASAKLNAFFDSVEGLFDYCFIDTNPSLSVKLAAALSCSDYVICPVELETYSLRGVKTMSTVINNVRQKYNPKLSFLGVVPSRVLNRNATQLARLEVLMETYPDMVIPCSISQLKAYSDALSQRVPVWDVDKRLGKKAVDEVTELGEFLINRMESLYGR